MDEIVIHVETEINPTEAEEKVKKAVTNLFGDIATQTESSMRGPETIPSVSASTNKSPLRGTSRFRRRRVNLRWVP